MTQRDPEPPPRFCPNCGAATVPGLSHCGACGQSLLPKEDHERLWGRNAEPPPFGAPEYIDLYPEDDLSSQTTTPFTQTRPFDPAERLAEPDDEDPVEKPVDPWSPSTGRLGRATASPLAPAGAAASVSSATARERSGPPGLLLGCLGFLLIAAVGSLLAWGAVRSVISDEIEDEIAVGISNELRTVERIPVADSGRIRVTEADVNDELRRNADLYDPVKDVTVAIDTDGITITFSLYGLTSTYRTGLAVENGRIVLVDSSLSGTAGRFVDEEDVGEIFEAELAELLRRSDLEPTGVNLRDGSVVIATAPRA